MKNTTQKETYEAVKDNILNHDSYSLKEFLIKYIQNQDEGLIYLDDYQYSYCQNVQYSYCQNMSDVSFKKFKKLSFNQVKKLSEEILFFRLNKIDILDLIYDS